MSDMLSVYRVKSAFSDKLKKTNHLRQVIEWIEKSPDCFNILLTTVHIGEEDEDHGWRSGEEVMEKGIDAWLTPAGSHYA